jgi:CubicO group peptidase (beta-lactamase class C family)
MDSTRRRQGQLYGCAFAVLLLAASISGCRGNESERVDAFVRAEMERQKIPGVAVAIVQGGEVVMARGYGLANVEHGVPVRSDTIFQSGSVGKQFTAVAVMLLVEDGKLALDDSIAEYIEEAPRHWRPISIRHLLTHTSGIPDYGEPVVDYRRDYSDEEFVQIAAGLELEFAAGARWNYSNTGYALLGTIVRRASGQFYGDILAERVFAPLGMETARVISEADIVPNRAAGYRLVEGELKNQEWVAPEFNKGADGALYFTALDLVAWDRGLRAGAILSSASWAQVFEPVKLNSGRSFPYGFGWDVEDFADQKVQRHGGSWQGFRADLVRYLGDELTIAVLANLAEAEPDRISDGIAGILNPKLARPELEPIPDREPQVTARLEGLLAAAREGRLVPEQFAYIRAGFFPETAEAYVELLGGHGEPERIELIERRELGDDRIYGYRMVYADARLRVMLGLAPDEQISAFYIWPE